MSSSAARFSRTGGGTKVASFNVHPRGQSLWVVITLTPAPEELHRRGRASHRGLTQESLSKFKSPRYVMGRDRHKARCRMACAGHAHSQEKQ